MSEMALPHKTPAGLLCFWFGWGLFVVVFCFGVWGFFRIYIITQIM